MRQHSNFETMAAGLSLAIRELQPDLSQRSAPVSHYATSAIDVLMADQVAEWEERADGLQEQELWLLKSATRLLSMLLSQGQVCLPLNRAPIGQLAPYWPSEVAWLEIFNKAESVWTTDLAGSIQPCWRGQPLVLTQAGAKAGSAARLYLARYFFYQQDVVKQLQVRLAGAEYQWQLPPEDAILQPLKSAYRASCLAGKQPSSAGDRQEDRQSIAVATAALLPVSFIVGGPGTGKTTTVARLLAMMLTLEKDYRVALAAPTGKAAARMTEAIQGAAEKFDSGQNFPTKAYTLHRLLGWSPGGFRYHSKRFLPYRMVILDEASMVDLPMMAHLLAALAPDTKLVMLGDRYQLASVEAGSVLADICWQIPHAKTPSFEALLALVMGENPPNRQGTVRDREKPELLRNAIIELTRSYRFGADTGIGQLALAINAGDIFAASEIFKQHPDVHMFVNKACSNGVLTQQDAQPLMLALGKGYRGYALKVRQYEQGLVSVEEVFRAFERFRVLVAVREGPLGMERINQLVETVLTRNSWLVSGRQSNWYAGRPLMVTRNDADTGLFNGDIGLLLKDNFGHLRAVFQMGNGEILRLLPTGLPPHETCFATTVHKCQGSEFDEVMLVLPSRRSKVVNRELLYTAVTRARNHFSVFTTEDCFNSGLSRVTTRVSGMAEMLWP